MFLEGVGRFALWAVFVLLSVPGYHITLTTQIEHQLSSGWVSQMPILEHIIQINKQLLPP